MFYFLGCILIFWLADLIFGKIKIKGQENIPRKSGFIIASNHVSYFDPPVIGYAIWRIRRLAINYLAKSELGKTNLLRRFFSNLNVVFIRRWQSDRKILKEALDLLRKDGNIIIFPQGSSRPERQKISSGVGFLAIRSRKPILPVKIEISGYERKEGFWPFSKMILKWFFGPGKIEVKFGPAINYKAELKDRQKITTMVMERINSL